MKLTITWLGQPKDIQTKYGPKQKNSLKAAEYGDKYLDFWVGTSTQNWKVGDSVEVEAVTDREYNGKTYYDVKMPKVDNRPDPAIAHIVSDIANKVGLMALQVDAIHKHLSGQKKLGMTSAGTPMPTFDKEYDAELESLDALHG